MARSRRGQRSPHRPHSEQGVRRISWGAQSQLPRLEVNDSNSFARAVPSRDAGLPRKLRPEEAVQSQARDVLLVRSTCRGRRSRGSAALCAVATV